MNVICVDKLTRYEHRPFGFVNWAHLWSDGDDLDELHAFAQRLGLKRAWFQPKKLLPHYDVAGEHKHGAALALGAVLIEDFGAYMHKRYCEQYPDSALCAPKGEGTRGR